MNENLSEQERIEELAKDQLFYLQLNLVPEYRWMEHMVRACLTCILERTNLEPDQRHGFTTLFKPSIQPDATVLTAHGRLSEVDGEEVEHAFLTLTRTFFSERKAGIPDDEIWDRLCGSLTTWQDTRSHFQHVQLLIPSYLASVFLRSGHFDVLEAQIPSSPSPRAQHRIVFGERKDTGSIFTLEFVLDDLLEPEDS